MDFKININIITNIIPVIKPIPPIILDVIVADTIKRLLLTMAPPIGSFIYSTNSFDILLVSPSQLNVTIFAFGNDSSFPLSSSFTYTIKIPIAVDDWFESFTIAEILYSKLFPFPSIILALSPTLIFLLLAVVDEIHISPLLGASDFLSPSLISILLLNSFLFSIGTT